MNPIIDGIMAVLALDTLLYIGLGVGLGMLVGAFPGVTATMAVALASGFTLTLQPVQGLAVLLTIYVAAQFGDRVPAILLNTPGTPASISTTFDGYPLAKQGKAGLALTTSALASAVGLLAGVVVLLVVGVPLARLARQFGPPEMFALVVFGLVMIISISPRRVWKGVAAGLFGILLSTVGRDPITGSSRFTFGVLELERGISFIAVIIGLFGVAEVLNQIITRHRGDATTPITQLGAWWPDRKLLRSLIKPTVTGTVTGAALGLVPAVGGDIAGILGWNNARRFSRKKDQFGKGSFEGITASDSSAPATLGGSVATTMALGVPGDSVFAVMIGSMMIWGLQPGPTLFANQPDLAFSLATIMVISTIVALALSLLRLKSMVRLLELPHHYLWVIILVFCMVGTFSVNNSVFDVGTMILFGVVGLFMLRFGFPPGPTVLGLILGPLAEANLRRVLISGGPEQFLESPIAIVLFLLAAAALILPALRLRLPSRRNGKPRASNEEHQHMSA